MILSGEIVSLLMAASPSAACSGCGASEVVPLAPVISAQPGTSSAHSQVSVDGWNFSGDTHCWYLVVPQLQKM